ncbi:metal ABC transporter permease [Falsiroseomonas selenitidurans]|uniref:Metal ABC transporter permease n=1 Tax=Falsiroseomonas selenitidurans TaxID=2716335 RepID=A0ABX1E0M3_9PROT|nr:metal ABC transporter permease [Falsiroseomonas selenitidurans]NKC29378.1 metal ABC transporter permease [Falsiroseomonas selenitidurans]
MSELLIPFEYDYMLRAMGISALVGAVAGLLSCYVVLKGWSLMGDALSHAIVPGVVLAWLGGIPFAVGAFASGLLAALAMAGLRGRTPIREDAVIGVVFTGFFGLGLFLLSLFPSNVRLQTIIFGNVLGIADADIIQMAIIAGVVALVLAIRGRDLMLSLFDPVQLVAAGGSPGRMRVLLLMLLAATAVAGLQAVGAVLVIGMLVTPGATAYLLADRFGRMAAIATVIGTTTGLAGAYASYFLDGSTGGSIVALQAAIFVVVLVFAPKHGIRATRRATAAAVAEGAA